MRAASRAAEAPLLDAVAAGESPRTRLLVGGDWTRAEGGREFEVASPATGEAAGHAADGSGADAGRAIAAASSALSAWGALPARERSELLQRAAELVEDHGEELARLIALESGKPLAEARGEPAYAAGFLRFAAVECEDVLATRAHPHPDEDKRVRTSRRPVGVAGLITVWNFPAAGVTRPLSAALAAGCTVVVKPAEQSPLTAVAICELLDGAGIPPGVVNLVTTGDPEAVARELIEDERVRKLSFTGSADVGTALARDAAARVKRTTLELGGHAPFIVFADADLDAAAEGAVRSKFRNSGQTCVCLNRLYVERPIYDEFTERLRERVLGLRAGDPLDGATDVGPLIDAAAVARVEEHVADALAHGARLLCGGRRAGGTRGEAGLLYAPTLLADVPPGALVMREETFGPVAPLAPFDDEGEVMAAANATPWGLAAYVYSGDPDRQDRVAAALDYGVVGVNDPLPAAPHLPFGGLKRSGLGKEGGRLGIEEFLDTQLISTRPS